MWLNTALLDNCPAPVHKLHINIINYSTVLVNNYNTTDVRWLNGLRLYNNNKKSNTLSYKRNSRNGYFATAGYIIEQINNDASKWHMFQN